MPYHCSEWRDRRINEEFLKHPLQIIFDHLLMRLQGWLLFKKALSHLIEWLPGENLPGRWRSVLCGYGCRFGAWVCGIDKIDANTAGKVGFLTNLMLKAMETGDYERRLKILEESVHENLW